jgi:hypothetical protein
MTGTEMATGSNPPNGIDPNQLIQLLIVVFTLVNTIASERNRRNSKANRKRIEQLEDKPINDK